MVENAAHARGGDRETNHDLQATDGSSFYRRYTACILLIFCGGVKLVLWKGQIVRLLLAKARVLEDDFLTFCKRLTYNQNSGLLLPDFGDQQA